MFCLLYFCLIADVQQIKLPGLQLEIESKEGLRKVAYEELRMPRALVYPPIPFETRFIVSEDGNGIYSGCGTLKLTRVLLKFSEYIEFIEFRINGKPHIYTLPQTRMMSLMGKLPKRELSGPASHVYSIYSPSVYQIILIHDSDTWKWLENAPPLSGISYISVSDEDFPLNQLLTYFDEKMEALIAARDRKTIYRDLAVLIAPRLLPDEKPPLTRKCDLILIAHNGEQKHVGEIEIPFFPERLKFLLYDKSKNMLILKDTEENIVLFDYVRKEMQKFPLPGTEKRKRGKLHNLAWGKDGSSLYVSIERPDGEYRMYRFYLTNWAWKYLGAYAILGSSTSGEWLFVGTPQNKENGWTINLSP
ncbi:MAG TPA: hypothetical protein VNK96_10060 [Fimbriimonadales bacterium]|nr:hypothetical protein [Fimbriimonadales bacterium]